MGIIAIIILGGIVGWIASRLLDRDSSIVGSIVIGIVGSFIGGFVSTIFTGADRSITELSWGGTFWAFIGALILTAILNAMSSSRRHHTV
ncbi:MAG: hypothetical protein JWN38_965 [Candidatus Saccharibacteria bacterium]|nr:hypothetical protein [Candidatus Saccharibacteria bacterium]